MNDPTFLSDSRLKYMTVIFNCNMIQNLQPNRRLVWKENKERDMISIKDITKIERYYWLDGTKRLINPSWYD